MTATHEQVEALLNFMKAHNDFARGLCRDVEGRARSKQLWKRLSISLNSMGSCTKSVKKWQKVWADRKHLAKKAAAVRRLAIATGDQAPTLSQVDLKILSILDDSNKGSETETRRSTLQLLPMPDPLANCTVHTPGDIAGNQSTDNENSDSNEEAVELSFLNGIPSPGNMQQTYKRPLSPNSIDTEDHNYSQTLFRPKMKKMIEVKADACRSCDLIAKTKCWNAGKTKVAEENDKRIEHFGNLLIEELKYVKPCLRTTVFGKILKSINSFKGYHYDEIDMDAQI